MIRIKKIFEDNSSRPERRLTKQEQSSVIERWGDDVDFIYFQKEDIETPEFSAMKAHQENKGDPFVEEKIAADKLDVQSIIEEIKKTYVLTPKAK